MADLSKTVEIILQLVDNTKTSLDGMAANFTKLNSVVGELQGNLSNTVTALQSLKSVTFPDMSAFSSGVNSIAKADVTNIKVLAENLKNVSGVKFPPGFSKFITDLQALSAVGNVPSLKGFSNAIREIGSVGNIPNLTYLVNGLQGMATIGELPNIKKISSAIAELGTVVNIPSLKTLVNQLKDLSSINKLPALAAFVSSLQALSKLSKFPNMNQLADSMLKFNTLGNLPSLGSFAAGLAALSKVKLLDTKNLVTFANAIKSFSGISAMPDIAGFTKSIKALSGIQMPSLTNFIANINKLSTAFANLGASSTVAQSIIAIGNAAQKVSTQIQSNTGSVEQNRTAWEKLAISVKNYVRYRLIADSIIYIKEAFVAGQAAIIDYDQALKNLQAIMQATDGEVVAMGNAIKRVATGTKFSATEVAQGMQILGQAGLSATEAVQSIGAVANLATGTLSEMSYSVDLITSAMRVFDLQASQSAHIADVFANAINASKLDIEKLRTAMNYVGPVAQSAGISLEETSAALMTLANSGLRASTMGTGLRAIISELSDPSAKLEKAARKAGISLESLNPSSNGLSTVLSNLDIVLSDTSVAFDVFGKRAASAALTLTRDVTSGYDDMYQKVNRFGTAQDMATKQMEGLGVAFKNLQDRLKLIAVALGESGVIGAFRLFISIMVELTNGAIWLVENGLRPILDILSPITTAFITMNPKIHLVGIALTLLAARAILAKTAMQGIAVAGAAAQLTTMGTAATAAAGGVGLLSGALTALRTVLSVFTGPVGWVIGGITALGVAISLSGETAEQQIRNFEKLRDEYNSGKTDLEGYTEEVQKMNSAHGEVSKNDVEEFMKKLINRYPELANEIMATGGNLNQLNEVLVRHKALIESIDYSSMEEGLSGYVNKLYEAQRRLESDNNAWKFFKMSGKERYQAEKDRDTFYNNAVALVKKMQDAGKKINWNEILGTKEYIKADSYFGKLREDILNGVSKMRSDLENAKFEDALKVTGLAGKVQKELNDADSFINKFISGRIAKSDQFAEIYGKIDPASVAKYKSDVAALIKGVEDAKTNVEGLSEQQRFEQRKAAEDKLTEYVRSANRKSADDTSIYYLNRAQFLEAEYAKELAQAQKGVDNVMKQKEIEYKVRLSYDKKVKEEVGKKVSIDSLRQSLDDTTAAYEKSYTDIVQTVAEKEEDGVLTHQQAEKKKLEYSLQRYESEYAAAVQFTKAISAHEDATDNDIEKAKKKENEAYIKAEEARTKIITEGIRVRTKLRKEEASEEDRLQHKLDKAARESLRQYTEEFKRNATERINALQEEALAASKISDADNRTAAEREINTKISQENVDLKRNELAKIKELIASGARGMLDDQYKAQAELYDAEFALKKQSLDDDKKVAAARLNIISESWRESAESIKQYRDAVQEAYALGLMDTLEYNRRMAESGRNLIDALKSGMQRALTGLRTGAEVVSQIGEDIPSQMADNFGSVWDDYIDGTKTATEAAVEWATTTLKWIAKVIIQQLILNAILAGIQAYTGSNSGPSSAPIGSYGDAVTVNAFADGGTVPGFSPHPKADNIPAWLTAEEFVQPVRAVRHYGAAFMESIRTLRFPKALTGMFTRGISIPSIPRSYRLADGGMPVTTGRSSGRAITNVTVINNTSAEATQSEKPNDMGGMDIEILIDSSVAKNIGKHGSFSNKAVRGLTGATPPLTRR